MTKKRLKQINIAGTWHVATDLDLHAEGSHDVNLFLAEVKEEFEKLVVRIGKKKSHAVVVKAIHVRVTDQPWRAQR